MLRAAGALLAALILTITSAGPLLAKGEGIPVTQDPIYREHLIHWKVEGDIQLILRKLVESSRGAHADVYARIVGKILRNPALTKDIDPAKRRTLFAAIIAHLVKTQPEDDNPVILLAESFLPLLAQDEALVEELIEMRFRRDPITHVRPGFDRLIERARQALSSDDPGVRGGAVRLLSDCECVDKADTVAAIHDALRATSKISAEDAEQMLAAVERLLGYRFRDINELTTFLSDESSRFKGRENWTDVDRYRVLSELLGALVKRLGAQGGAQETEAREAALDYGRALIRSAKGPDTLMVFFTEGRPIVPVLQREALDAARRLEPSAAPPWAALLTAALAQSEDQAVLEATVGLLNTFAVRPADGTPLAAAVGPLAEAIAARLVKGTRTDRLDLRQRLADALGQIGTASLVQRVLDVRDDTNEESQQAVWARLIRALGVVRDGLVATLRPHYRRAEQARPEWERLAVAETLGQKGFRPSAGAAANLEAPQAALFLMHILHGVPGVAVAFKGVPAVGDTPASEPRSSVFIGKAALESEAAKEALARGTVVLEFAAATPDASNAVREAAVNSLNFHAGPETAQALGQAAAEAGDVGAAALSTLSLQLGRGSVDAAQALAEFIRGGPSDERLQAALQIILTRKMPTTNVARLSLGSAVRGLLTQADAASPVSEAVRRKAGEAAAKLYDLESLKPIYLAWRARAPEDSEGQAAWLQNLRGLIEAVARASATSEALQIGLESAIKDQAEEDVENVGTFVSILAAIKSPTFGLKRLHASLASQYQGIQKGRTKDERRAELDRVITLYTELAGDTKAGAADRLDMQALLYDALHRRWNQWLKSGEEAESPAEFQLRALVAAAASGRGDIAQLAQESEGAALLADQGLSKEKAAQRDALLTRIDVLVKTRKATPEAPAPKDEPKKAPAKDAAPKAPKK